MKHGTKVFLFFGSGLILLIFLCAFLISLAEGIAFINVISKFIIFVGRGSGKILFTPNFLWILLVFALFISPDKFLNLCKELGEVFEQLGIAKFRNKNTKPEEPINTDKIPETIQTSSIGRSERKDVNFYKDLLTRNSATIVSRFLIYTIDRPGMPPNFNLQQLIEWTFGKQALQSLIEQNALDSLSYPACLLVQTGALEGSFNISGNGVVIFESTRVSPAAHQALEELMREGYQMTPQVIIS